LLVQHVQEMLTVLLAFLVVGPICFLADFYKLPVVAQLRLKFYGGRVATPTVNVYERSFSSQSTV